MRVSSMLKTLAARALYESMDNTIMTRLANDLIPNYDIFKRTGFSYSETIPKQDAARQIIQDVVAAGLFFDMIYILVGFHNNGYFGRPLHISNLREIFREILQEGFVYDEVNKIFVEDSQIRRSRNWGTLTEGREYYLAFLRLDIVGNSKLVRKYPEQMIKDTYRDLLTLVEKAIDSRNGRVWNWEGDGGLVAFYFGHKTHMAVLSAIEIINEVFLYNFMHRRFSEPLRVRVSVHSGLCDYTENLQILMKNDTIKKTIQLESTYTEPNTVTVSDVIKRSIDPIFDKFLMPIKADKSTFFRYSVKME